MSTSYRHDIFPEDGSLKRIADALPFGRDAIPECAGTTQRIARVIVELEDARPVRILDARGFLLQFDEDGRTNEDIRQRAADRMDLLVVVPAKRGGHAVDLVPKLKRREPEARRLEGRRRCPSAWRLGFMAGKSASRMISVR